MQKTVTSIVSRRNCRFKSGSLFRDSLNGQDTGSIEFKLFLNFSVCYTMKAAVQKTVTSTGNRVMSVQIRLLSRIVQLVECQKISVFGFLRLFFENKACIAELQLLRLV